MSGVSERAAMQARLAEYQDEWLWHEQTDESLAGHGHHMGQMLARLPLDGQTRDMQKSIESMLRDLSNLLAQPTADEAEGDFEWGVTTDADNTGIVRPCANEERARRLARWANEGETRTVMRRSRGPWLALADTPPAPERGDQGGER